MEWSALSLQPVLLGCLFFFFEDPILAEMLCSGGLMGGSYPLTSRRPLCGASPPAYHDDEDEGSSDEDLEAPFPRMRTTSTVAQLLSPSSAPRPTTIQYFCLGTKVLALPQ